MSTYFVYKINKFSVHGYMGIDNELQFEDSLEAGSAIFDDACLPEKTFVCYQHCDDIERLFRLTLHNFSKISQTNSIGGFAQSFRSRKLANLNNKTQNYINPSGSKQPVGRFALCDNNGVAAFVGSGGVSNGVEMLE